MWYEIIKQSLLRKRSIVRCLLLEWRIWSNLIVFKSVFFYEFQWEIYFKLNIQKQSPRKICIKFTEEHPCRSVISVKLQSNFIEIILRHGCSPVNLLHTFRTPFLEERLWTAASKPDMVISFHASFMQVSIPSL